MTFKKSLCAVMAIFMLFSLTACKSGKLDNLEIKLCGVTVKAPLTLDKLGDDFTLFGFGEFDGVVEVGGKTSGILLHKGELVADVIFKEGSKESDYRKRKIESIMSFSEDFSDGLSVNGFMQGYVKSQALDMIGEPTEKIQSNDFMTNDPLETWVYRENGASEDDSYLVIGFDKYDKAWEIIVDLE